MDSLTFEATSRFIEEDGVILTAVTPLVNGQKVLSKGEFDVLQVLAGGLDTQEAVDIFTCSCGEAGCAGIFNDCRILVEADKVCWLMPVANFHPDEVPALERMGDNYIRMTFGRAEYETALEQLRTKLSQDALEKGKPVCIGPGWTILQDDAWAPDDVANQLRLCGERYIKNRDEHIDYLKHWGPLLSKEVHLTCANGYPLGITPNFIVGTLVENRRFDSPEEAEKFEKALIAEMLADDDNILRLTEELSWKNVMDIAWGRGNELNVDEDNALFTKLSAMKEWPELTGYTVVSLTE